MACIYGIPLKFSAFAKLRSNEREHCEKGDVLGRRQMAPKCMLLWLIKQSLAVVLGGHPTRRDPNRHLTISLTSLVSFSRQSLCVLATESTSKSTSTSTSTSSSSSPYICILPASVKMITIIIFVVCRGRKRCHYGYCNRTYTSHCGRAAPSSRLRRQSLGQNTVRTCKMAMAAMAAISHQNCGYGLFVQMSSRSFIVM
ncbi:hypothetical protein ACLKA6_009665 [Drosophila palustris]